MKMLRKIEFSDLLKTIRAEVIKEFMQKAGFKKAICFSCGNANKKLIEAGIDVLSISPNGDLIALRWFEQYEILSKFENYFDATSGHLSISIINEISKRLRDKIILDKNIDYIVPTGSGETILCLKIAFPKIKFIAIYNETEATLFNEKAPLNELIKTFFEIIK